MNLARLVKIADEPICNLSYWMNRARSISSLELVSGMRHLSSSLGTIVDVGANKGQFTVASRLMFPEAHIYSYEPHPSAFKKLAENVKQLPNIEIFNIGLGSEERQLDFFLSGYDLASSFHRPSEIHTFHFPEAIIRERVKVNVRRLDKVIQEKLRRPSLLKLDVQGFELEVVKGSTQILSQIDFILVEMSFQPMYEREPLFDEVNDFLRSKGFSITTLLGTLLGRGGTILQIDALYALKGLIDR